jgi:hypothetical protein
VLALGFAAASLKQTVSGLAAHGDGVIH